ncbi:MAG: glycosyltransferase family 39 protein [Thermoplasmata archaeon]|nr:glycosyltransferase family 39 protein [Thermoplasmata archaeon]
MKKKFMLRECAQKESMSTTMMKNITKIGKRWTNLKLPEFDIPPGFFLILILTGIILRILSFWFVPASTDAFVYAAMGEGFLKHGEFVLPLGNSFFVPGSPEFSHHFPPLYPLYLSVFILFFGVSVEVLKIASIISGLLLIPVTYFCTSNLWGRRMGHAAAGIMAVEPASIYIGGLGFAENLLCVFFILTMWAILKGIKDEKYIVFAGLFAGLSYLTKSSMGWFFLIAGICGFIWRFYYIRWQVFKSRYYMVGIGVFITCWGIWAMRNIIHFWDGNFFTLFTAWETSDYIAHVQFAVFSYPGEFLYVFLLRIPLFMLFFLMLAWPWLPDIWKMKKLEETSSALFLSIGLVYFIGMFFASAFWVFERHPIFWFLIIRYVMPANISIIWLAVHYYREGGEEEKKRFSFNRGWLTTILTVFIVSLVVTTPLIGIPRERGEIKALEWLRENGHVGMSIALQGVHQYEVYIYLHDFEPEILGINTTPAADYILTTDTDASYTDAGYAAVSKFCSSGGFMENFNVKADAVVWKRM